MQSLYSERGGLKKGKSFLISWNASWPLVKLEVFVDKIILSMFWFKTKLHISEIDSFEKFGFGRIKINHHNSQVSPFILFFSWDSTKLLDKLSKFGYPIKNTEI